MCQDRYIINFYNSYDEDARFNTKSGSVEFLTTMRYVEKYIKRNDRVLDIGAGTGRYSHTLARRGYQVDAVELVPHNIDVFQKNTLSDERVTIRQGNALDLSFFPDNTYDITLLFGPLYHLYRIEDKRQALREAIRVTKPNGIIFAAYVITDGSLIDKGFAHHTISIADYIRCGMIHEQTFAAKSEPKDIFELVRLEDIYELTAAVPVTRLHYVATDGWASFMRETIDAMDDDSFRMFLKYHFATCERKDFVGLTSHSLDILRKK